MMLVQSLLACLLSQQLLSGTAALTISTKDDLIPANAPLHLAESDGTGITETRGETSLYIDQELAIRKTPWTKFWEVATVLYHYKCPVGGDQNRVMQIKVDFDGSRTKYVNLRNAEKFSAGYVKQLDDESYKVHGTFEHKVCLPAGGRKCSYSITATLVATAWEHPRQYHFDIPDRPGEFITVPKVTETCSRAGDTRCPAKSSQPCEVMAAFIAP